MKPDRSKSVNVRIWISLLVMSLSVVAFEIHLMHFFSIVQWQHFASMVISIALLGYGTSGTLLSLFRKKLLKHSSLLISLFMITAGLLMILALPLSRYEFFRLDTFTLFTDRTQIPKLTLNYLLFFLPFLFAALAIGLIFVKKASRIGYYYFADMLGAGLGGLLAILLMWSLDLSSIPLAVSVLPIGAGLLQMKWTHKKESILLTLYALGCLALAFFVWIQPLNLKASDYKSISYALNLPEAEIEIERHSPYGWLQVVSSPVQRFAPGLSLGAPLEVPSSPVVYNNGNWYAPLPVSESALDVLDYSTMAAPYRLRQVQHFLQLGAGAGFEVRYALKSGAELADAVESHVDLLDLLGGSFAARTDSVFYDPRIRWHATSSRSFLEKTITRYDLVQLPLLGTFGGSVGLNALEEDWVLTEEGFQAIWDTLDEKGMLAVSCWIDMPQKMSVRLGALMANLLEENGMEKPSENLAVIRSWGTLTFVVSKSRFTSGELSGLKAFCRDRQFDLVTVPEGGAEGEVNSESSPGSFNLIQDPDFEKNLHLALSSDRDSLLANFPFHVQIPNDDKPYFFQFLRLSQWKEQKSRWGESRTAFLELGYLILWTTFAQVLIFALVFVLLPLLKLKKSGRNKGKVILYFASLGVGYMFLEMVLIKFFNLYLGHPIYSAATVISAMLISSGLGSLYSERIGLKSRSHRRVLALVTLMALAYSFLLGPLLSSTVGLSYGLKFVITLVVVGLPAFFMGMPFPLGLKKLDALNRERVPWAWGVNGFASVISVSLAVILAVEFGFVIVLLLSAFAYFMSFISARSLA